MQKINTKNKGVIHKYISLKLVRFHDIKLINSIDIELVWTQSISKWMNLFELDGFQRSNQFDTITIDFESR